MAGFWAALRDRSFSGVVRALTSTWSTWPVWPVLLDDGQGRVEGVVVAVARGVDPGDGQGAAARRGGQGDRVPRAQAQAAGQVGADDGLVGVVGGPGALQGPPRAHGGDAGHRRLAGGQGQVLVEPGARDAQVVHLAPGGGGLDGALEGGGEVDDVVGPEDRFDLGDGELVEVSGGRRVPVGLVQVGHDGVRLGLDDDIRTVGRQLGVELVTNKATPASAALPSRSAPRSSCGKSPSPYKYQHISKSIT